MSTNLDFKKINQLHYSQILQTLEKKKIACSVFLDFAKAFDTVDHEIVPKT